MKIEEYVLKYYKNFLIKSWIIDLFTIPIFDKFDIAKGKLNISSEDIEDNPYTYYNGKIFESKIADFNLYFISNVDPNDLQYTKLDINKKLPLLNKKGKINLTKNDLPFLFKNIESTYGKLLVNTLLVAPFEGSISYHNENNFSISKLKKEFKSITSSDENIIKKLKVFFTNFDYISGYSSIFSPSLPIESILPNKKVEKRKKELFAKHKSALENSDPIVTIELEQELIKLDAAAAKENEDYDIISSPKTFNNVRKRMFTSMGNIESFGDKEVKFCKSSLDEGLVIEDLPVLFNEIRRGSYHRGISTAKSGADTKNNSRMFQDIIIAENDCKTKHGIKCVINNREQLLGRYIIDKKNTILMSEKNVDKYLNKNILLRSPLFCKTVDGNYCYKCCELLWELKKIKLLNVIPIAISASIMGMSMAATHTSVMTLYDIVDIDEFIS